MRGISRHLNCILACKLGMLHFLFSGYEILAKEKKIEHWTYIKPIKSKVPENSRWGYNEIDFFILEDIPAAKITIVFVILII